LQYFSESSEYAELVYIFSVKLQILRYSYHEIQLYTLFSCVFVVIIDLRFKRIMFSAAFKYLQEYVTLFTPIHIMLIDNIESRPWSNSIWWIKYTKM